MKIKSELRKMNVDEKFIGWVLKSRLSWEEKVLMGSKENLLTSDLLKKSTS